MSADRAETPVVLSRIYTRTGDDGTTALGDCSRAAKTDPRLAAYADVDEANCAIGVAVTMGSLPGDVRELLVRIQNELFDVGADLCNPITPDPRLSPAAGRGGLRRARSSRPATSTTRTCPRCAASCCPAAAPAPRCCTPPAP